MYLSFFGLSEKPFSITPDPRYLYLSERHAEALAHLLYGINESGGFIQLTGEVGTGKTTVVRTLLSRVPHHADVAVILNPRVTPVEFLLTICEELGLVVEEDQKTSVKHLVDSLNQRLLAGHAEGRRIIVIVDEAQNLSADVLEQVRLLTNLETPTQKLLQIILIGQPELRELLDRNDLRQLAQRITGRYHLSPLSREETKGYVRHRLRVAGAAGEIFSNGALSEVYRLSAGVPRIINVTCDRALLGAYTQETRKVTPALVRRAAAEVYGRMFLPPWAGWALGVGIAAGLIGVGVLTYQVWQHSTQPARGLTLTAPGGKATPAVADEAAAGGAHEDGASGGASGGANGDAATGDPPHGEAVSGGAERGSAAGLSRGLPKTPAPTNVSIDALLSANSAGTTDAAAFRRLLSLWGSTLVGEREPCAQAAKAGLACLEQRGSWAQVRALNRPAILTLNDGGGQRHRVVLSALDDGYATLDFGDHSERVPIAEVSRDWFGEFTVVWKPKTARTRQLSVGMQGDEVRWLRRSLNALHGAAADPERGDVYDEQLAIAVQNFQREHQLNVDGIAGIQTQVVLDTALAEPGSPILLHASPHG